MRLVPFSISSLSFSLSLSLSLALCVILRLQLTLHSPWERQVSFLPFFSIIIIIILEPIHVLSHPWPSRQALQWGGAEALLASDTAPHRDSFSLAFVRRRATPCTTTNTMSPGFHRVILSFFVSLFLFLLSSSFHQCRRYMADAAGTDVTVAYNGSALAAANSIQLFKVWWRQLCPASVNLQALSIVAAYLFRPVPPTYTSRIFPWQIFITCISVASGTTALPEYSTFQKRRCWRHPCTAAAALATPPSGGRGSWSGGPVLGGTLAG